MEPAGGGAARARRGDGLRAEGHQPRSVAVRDRAGIASGAVAQCAEVPVLPRHEHSRDHRADPAGTRVQQDFRAFRIQAVPILSKAQLRDAVGRGRSGVHHATVPPLGHLVRLRGRGTLRAGVLRRRLCALPPGSRAPDGCIPAARRSGNRGHRVGQRTGNVREDHARGLRGAHIQHRSCGVGADRGGQPDPRGSRHVW